MSADLLTVRPESAPESSITPILHNKQELSTYLKTINRLFSKRLKPDDSVEDLTRATVTPVELKSTFSQTDFDAAATSGLQPAPTIQDLPSNGPHNDLQPLSETKAGECTPQKINEKDFVAIPLVVDVWKMQCLQGESVSTCALHNQPKYFATGYVVWKILKHYFPSDIPLELYKYPQTRKQYAEVWSHVDLVLQKHNLNRIPVDVIAAILDHHQAGQAVILMLLYETLTNLKISHPIPRLRYQGNFEDRTKDGKPNSWKPTVANKAHGVISYRKMLQQLFTTNQRLAFARSHRQLRPPSFYRPLVSKHELMQHDDESSLLKRLTRRPNGARCHIFHEDRERYVHLIAQPDPVKTLVATLQPPFFPNVDAMVKQSRVKVIKVPILIAQNDISRTNPLL